MSASQIAQEGRRNSEQSSVNIEMAQASPITATMSDASASATATDKAIDQGGSLISQKSASSALASPTAVGDAHGPSKARASPARTRGGVPPDVIRLDALLVGGQRRFFDVKPEESARVVKQRILDQWPEDWPAQPLNSSSLRLLHLGHFVEDRTTLGERGMRTGAVTVVHVLIPADPSKAGGGDGDDASLKKGSGGGRARAARSSSASGQEETVGGGCRCVVC